MRTLVLRLFNSKNRPVFKYTVNGMDVMALIDSGAETPVWCTGSRKFEKVYPDARRQDWETEIRGFGGNLEKAAVYVIPDTEDLTRKTGHLIIVAWILEKSIHYRVDFE